MRFAVTWSAIITVVLVAVVVRKYGNSIPYLNKI